MFGKLRLLFLFFLVKFISYGEGQVVKTSLGEVEGVEVPSILKDEKYYSFMGVPYAEPPLGSLRFMQPIPHKGWTGVLKAKKEKKSCAQLYLPVRKIKEAGFTGDEDCLHLSIHTPKIDPNANMPVIVFLYNEHFKTTYNNSREYGPDFFMKEEVILVMVNHRIGSLGFLGFEDDLLPGNNGIRDVLLALTWIKENIHNFGGDPYRVTLMGYQDGAGLVDILLHSPVAKGMFSNAILQSGTSWSSSYFVEKTRDRAIKLAEVLETKATTSSHLLQVLANINGEKLAESELYSVSADEARALQKGIFAFGPTIEQNHPEAIITRSPENGPIDIDVPVMIGYTSREGLEACSRYLVQPQFLTYADKDFLFLFPIRNDYHFKITDNVYNHAVRDIKDFYFDQSYVKISKPGEYFTYFTDVISFYPIDYTVRKYTNESKSHVFYYTFDYNGELNMRKKMAMEDAKIIDGTWGATLGDDLCYLFVCKPLKKAYLKALEDENSEEIKVVKNMVRMWSNFAKTGNPTPPGEAFTWKPATKENKECLVINDGLELRSNLHAERVQFWDNFIAEHREKAVDGVVKDIKDEL